MAANTAGPWRYERTGKNTGVIKTNLGTLAEIRWRGFVDTPAADAEKDANGHLMAAGPALLPALEEWKGLYPSIPMNALGGTSAAYKLERRTKDAIESARKTIRCIDHPSRPVWPGFKGYHGHPDKEAPFGVIRCKGTLTGGQ